MSMFFHHANKVDPHGTVYQLPPKPNTLQAPEMSTQGFIPAVLLLAGLLAVMFGRRRRGAQ